MNMEAKTFDELTSWRRSVRVYDGQKDVSDDELVAMVRAAQEAPSWKNSQTARYYVARSPEMVERVRACLLSHNPAITAGAKAMIVTSYVSGVAGFGSDGSADNELGDGWGVYDLGLGNAWLLLKTADLGLDTVVMGLRDAGALRRLLSIPECERVVAVIAVGHRAKDVPRPLRKSLDEVCRFF